MAVIRAMAVLWLLACSGEVGSGDLDAKLGTHDSGNGSGDGSKIEADGAREDAPSKYSDGGELDARVDADTDGAVSDGSIPDSSVPDSAVPDGPVPDSGAPDGAVPDSAVPDSAVPDGAVGEPDAGGEPGPTTQLVGMGGAGVEIDSLWRGTRLFTMVECGGVWASDDRGGTWFEAAQDIPTLFEKHRLWGDPYDSSTLFIGHTGYILKSTDSGESWATVLVTQDQSVPAQRRNIADFAAVDELHYLAIEGDRRAMFSGPASVPFGVSQGRLWLSDDAGESWSEGVQVTSVAPADLMSIYVHPVTNRLFVATTVDGVRTAAVADGPWEDLNMGMVGSEAHRLAAAPGTVNPGALYVTMWDEPGSTSRIYSIDVGTGTWTGDSYDGAWEDITYDLPDDSSLSPSTVGRDLYDIVVNASGVVYVTNFAHAGNERGDLSDGGVYRLDGTTWTHLTRTGGATPNMTHGWLAEAHAFVRKPSGTALAIDPADPDVLTFTTPLRDQRFLSEDAGATWNQVYSIDHGDGTWSHRGMTLTTGNAIAVDPCNSDRILIGYGDYSVSRSEDGGASWRHIGAIGPVGTDANEILFDPEPACGPGVDRDVWYVSGFRDSSGGHGIYQSSNSGVTWTRIGGGNGDENDLPGGYTFDVAIDLESPVGSRTIYVVVEGHGVYKRVGSALWTRIDGSGSGLPDTTSTNWPLRAIAIDPGDGGSRPRTIYVGFRKSGTGTGGIFRTVDEGVSWDAVTGGVGQPANKSIVRHIEINPNTGALYIATETAGGISGGAFRLVYGAPSWTTLVTDSKVAALHLLPGPTNADDVVYISGQQKPVGRWASGAYTNLESRLPEDVFLRGGKGIFYDENSDALYATILCGGVYRIDAP